MNLNLTDVFEYLNIALWLLGVVLGTYAVHLLARDKVGHVGRSTLIGVVLSLVPPLVLIQVILLIRTSSPPRHANSD